MQTDVSYRNVLFAYANRTPSKQKFSGIQHNFKQMCGTASFVGHVESNSFGSTGGSGGPERKKSAQA